MSQTDKELLEMAAKAEGRPAPYDQHGVFSAWVGDHIGNGHWWDPLNDDGDALRLAVALKIHAYQWDSGGGCTAATIDSDYEEPYSRSNGDYCAATRRAIVRAAAGIGGEIP